MTTTRLPAVTLAALLAAAPLVSMADTPPATGQVTGGVLSVHPDWFKESFLDIGEDVSEAAEQGKHVILFLEMTGCPYCFKMIEENFKHAPYVDFLRERFDVIALNIKGDREVALNEDTTATEKAIADLLGVRYTPTIVFLGQDNRPVARVNGYRNPQDFKQVLEYVAARAYQHQSLSDYLNGVRVPGVYQPRAHPQLTELTDLSQAADRPLAVLVEDSACLACDDLHDGHLARPEVRLALADFTFVRLDALSEEPMIDPAGKATTPKEWVKSLGLTYRPGILLFDRGAEIARIESMLYSYHFTGVLEYVGRRHYERYPESPFRYIDAKTAEILATGQDVRIAD
jgi:thioredoxin-related protein